MNPREQYERETGKRWYREVSITQIAHTYEYGEWLERRAACAEQLAETKQDAEMTQAAIRAIGVPTEPCRHCDPDVGWMCPCCGLEMHAGDLARRVLAALAAYDAACKGGG